jgi:hypothetical protein
MCAGLTLTGGSAMSRRRSSLEIADASNNATTLLRVLFTGGFSF